MYIEPNTNIKLLKNVPLDNSYSNTIYFADKSSQIVYFSSKVKHNLANYTYQRVNKGSMRVGLSADKCYDCNYLMFQNTSYGSKWFYAFITSVEYINNEVCEIRFEIDVMQTWFYSCTLKQCFVEREHSETDNVGDNIQPEPVNVGEYVVSDYSKLTAMNDSVIVVAIVDVDGGSNGELYDGIYGGAQLWAYQASDIVSINSKIDSYKEKPESILSIYMCPALFIQDVPTGGKKLLYGAGATPNIVSTDQLNDNADFQGYVPKNKKLYTYPYNYFNLDNANGNSLPLRYEFFDNLTPVVEITGVITQPVKCVARPCSYKGVPSQTELGGYTTLNSESISLESYPICSWNTDTWSQFVAQQSVPIALSVISGAGTTSANVAMANMMNARSVHPLSENEQSDKNKLAVSGGILSSVCSTMSTIYSASIASDICRGSFNNGGVNFSNNKQQFFKSRVHITKNHCEAIDNFFSAFGYKTNLIKTPNISSRPHWNYVKTINCTIVGEAPSDDIATICGIFNNGITFWKNGDEVGNYNLDNSPV